eukprot:gene26741-biopygen17275
MLGGSGGGPRPTQLPPSISPPHLEWALVPTTLTMDSYDEDTGHG